MISDLEIRGRSKDTIKNMICSITNFSKYYDCPPENLGEKDIINYLKYCINDRKLCRGTVNYINSNLKFFYVITLEGTWSDLRILKLRYYKKLPKYLTREEVKTLLEHATYLKDKAILSTIYSSGLRVSEVINLKISDIMSKEMKIRVKKGKRHKERYTLLSQKNLELLRKYWVKFGYKNYSPDDYLFISRKTGKPLTNCGVQCDMENIAVKAGITTKPTPHTLRHYVECYIMVSG
ncbi:tyrosine-type recombinase/integrase [Clostridium gasigenes]|uniref:tyrosine-type recombinase/integrase n=1 Tax=Clostridium gasigenes TaxID=94869 RepID=UPI001A9C0077|nr:tyrosine-type recombinase/integrase [Clostridium gasigenes]